MLETVAVVLWGFSLGFSGALIWLNWVQYRRWRRLNLMLGAICTQAWMMRHLPIWVPWSDFTGIGFKVGLSENFIPIQKRTETGEVE